MHLEGHSSDQKFWLKPCDDLLDQDKYILVKKNINVCSHIHSRALRPRARLRGVRHARVASGYGYMNNIC